MISPVSKNTKDLTSYDFLKTLAVVSMIIDHIGYYLFPDQLIWRAIGRTSFPVWFFLVGYARNDAIGRRLVGGALLLALIDGAIGIGVIPFNVLVTIILIRLLRRPLMSLALKNKEWAIIVPVSFMILLLPSFYILEYGMQGFLFAMLGYIARRRPVIGAKHNDSYNDSNNDSNNDINLSRNISRGPSDELAAQQLFHLYLFLCFASYGFQQVTFAFPALYAGIMFLLGGGTMVLLYRFRPQTYPRLSTACPEFLKKTIQIMGRRTLEIYVGHLLLFKAWVLYTQPERFELGHWAWAQFHIF